MKNLRIDLDKVETSVDAIKRGVSSLETMHGKLPENFGEGWQSANAQKVSEGLRQMKESVDKIKSSIDSISVAVGQYGKNVENVDQSVSLNSGN